MGVLKIDYNRGVMKKVEQKTGIEVYMYLDLPGVYYNSFETEVSDEQARAAGFDTEKFGKQKRRREQLAIAMKAIDDQLDMESEEKEVIMERGGFRVVHIGLGRHVIEDPDGGQLVDRHLTLEEAKTALERLVPQEDTVKKVAVKSMATA